MEKHAHKCNCGNSHDLAPVSGLILRWSFTLVFITFSFIVMRPWIAGQLLLRGASYMTCESFDDAIRAYKKSLFIYGNNAQDWDKIAYAYKSKGDMVNTLYAYRQAVKVDPRNKNANFGLGVILTSQKKYQEAIPYLETIRQLGPEKTSGTIVNLVSYHKPALKLLADCYGALKEFDKKNAVLEELNKYYPNDR